MVSFAATRVPGRRRFAWVLCAAFALALPRSVVAADPPLAKGRLFRIAQAGVPDSFVFGTIHIADRRISTPSRAVRDALSRSRTLAVELVPEALDAGAAELEMLEGGRRLEPLLGAEAFAQLRARLLAQDIDASAIERLKPWAAMMKLGRHASDANGAGLDANLFVAARAARLRILPLELLDEQISAFDTIPLDTQVALLRHALVHREAMSATIEPMIDAWRRGELAALPGIAARSFDTDPAMRAHHAEMMRHLIANRTVLMHHRLAVPLRSGRVFVAVGAMHLIGSDGLLALLRADGYRITRVW